MLLNSAGMVLESHGPGGAAAPQSGGVEFDLLRGFHFPAFFVWHFIPKAFVVPTKQSTKQVTVVPLLSTEHAHSKSPGETYCSGIVSNPHCEGSSPGGGVQPQFGTGLFFASAQESKSELQTTPYLSGLEAPSQCIEQVVFFFLVTQDQK